MSFGPSLPPPGNLLIIFRIPFPKNTCGGLLLRPAILDLSFGVINTFDTSVLHDTC